MKTLLCLLACLALVACGGNAEQADSQATTEDHGHAEVASHDGPVAAGTYTVACGCSIEGVGHCGNYIEVAGSNYEIANGQEMGLGKMEWCGKSDNTAEAEGEIKDGKFVAAQLTIQ